MIPFLLLCCTLLPFGQVTSKQLPRGMDQNGVTGFDTIIGMIYCYDFAAELHVSNLLSSRGILFEIDTLRGAPIVVDHRDAKRAIEQLRKLPAIPNRVYFKDEELPEGYKGYDAEGGPIDLTVRTAMHDPKLKRILLKMLGDKDGKDLLRDCPFVVWHSYADLRICDKTGKVVPTRYGWIEFRSAKLSKDIRVRNFEYVAFPDYVVGYENMFRSCLDILNPKKLSGIRSSFDFGTQSPQSKLYRGSGLERKLPRKQKH